MHCEGDELTNIVLNRILELEKIKVKYESQLSKTSREDWVVRRKYIAKIAEVERLIATSERLYLLKNGGKLQ